MSSYKTFDDLVFNNHPSGVGKHARLILDNGIEVSVVHGPGYYSGDGTYEIAMLVEGKFLPLDRWDDVLGWQTAEEIDTLLETAQVDGVKFMDNLDKKRSDSESGE